MPFRPPKKQPQFADLKGILAQTKGTENPLYQTVEAIIERLTQFQQVTLEQIEKGQTTVRPSGTVNIIVREIPSGSIDGINTIFILLELPVAGSEQVYLNGLLQDTRGVDYTISGRTVTFLVPPAVNDRVLVTYQRA